MATKITLPMLGQTMEEGTITRWLKNEGDAVQKDEPIYEVMTDKANFEVEAPESGVLRKILVKPDETIPIFAPVAIIGTADESIDDLLKDEKTQIAATSQPTAVAVAPAATQAKTEAVVSSEKVFASPRAKLFAKDAGIDVSSLAGLGTGPGGRVVEKDVQLYASQNIVKSTPLAAQIAQVDGIDLRGVAGTGPGGRITKGDVFGASKPVAPAVPAQVIPFTGLRKLIADNVSASAYTAPHVTLTLEVDMTEAVNVRKSIVGPLETKYGTRVTFTDFIAKAVTVALKDHPMLNSTIKENEIHQFNYVNLGIAVALENGLIVPVIKNADQKSVVEISQETKELAGKVRSNSIMPDDISGGTFTITNLGAYGIDVFDPIIATGQAAILGVCRIAEKPVVVDGQIVVRSMMNLCLSFDHRIVDGAPAAKFLQDLKNLLESPVLLLI